MPLKTQLLTELDTVIADGNRLEASMRMESMGTYESSIPEPEFRSFVTTALATIDRITGSESAYSKTLNLEQLSGALSVPGYARVTMPSIIGALTALRGAVDRDLLVTLEDQLRASIHDDFLQQAKALLDASYYVAAMVVVGGVLEDHLRKLCGNRKLTWTGDGSLSRYNDLLKGKAYQQADWRRIQSIGDVRNHAAHGEYAKVKVDDVKDALTYTARLLSDHPA